MGERGPVYVTNESSRTVTLGIPGAETLCGVLVGPDAHEWTIEGAGAPLKLPVGQCCALMVDHHRRWCFLGALPEIQRRPMTETRHQT